MAQLPSIPLTQQPLIPLTQQPSDAPIPAEVPVASGVSAFGNVTLWLVALVGILFIAAIIGISLRSGRRQNAPSAPSRNLT